MLEINGVTKSFAAPEGGSSLALDTFNLSVGEHEIVSLVGTSGCGKSTLLRILSGLDSASDGGVTIAGQPVTGPNPDIAMVFQEPRLMPWLTVRENVRLALLDLSRNEQDELIAEALGQVGLDRHADLWLAPWRGIRRSCCWTSPSPRSIPSPGRSSRCICWNCGSARASQWFS